MNLYGYSQSSQNYRLNKYSGDVLVTEFYIIFNFNTHAEFIGAPMI